MAQECGENVLDLDQPDWDQLWFFAQQLNTEAAAPAFWDNRSRGFLQKQPTEYNRCFLEYADILPGESVLDMGCGTGTFAISLAQQGHSVIAVDFSPTMLEGLQTLIEAHGLVNIQTIQCAWDDDWHASGISEGSVDVALASRSLTAGNLSASLRKLDSVARRRVCLTVGVESFPFIDIRVFQAVGRVESYPGDYLIILNALARMGIKAEVRFMGTPRRDVYLNRETARATIASKLGALTDLEDSLLESYLTDHLIPWRIEGEALRDLKAPDKPDDYRVPAPTTALDGTGVYAGAQSCAQTGARDSFDTSEKTRTSIGEEGVDYVIGVAIDYIRDMRWAFISWDKQLPGADIKMQR